MCCAILFANPPKSTPTASYRTPIPLIDAYTLSTPLIYATHLRTYPRPIYAHTYGHNYGPSTSNSVTKSYRPLSDRFLYSVYENGPATLAEFTRYTFLTL